MKLHEVAASYRVEDTVCTRDCPHARHQLQVQEVSNTALRSDKSLERLRKFTESSCSDSFGLLQGKERDSDQPQEELYRAESHGSPQLEGLWRELTLVIS